MRPGRDRLAGRVEVDEAYWGAAEAGVRGRQLVNKVLIAVAVEQVGRHGLGRIRMRRVKDASADTLQAFVEDAIQPGSLVHTDGWAGYDRLEQRGYRHRITFQQGRPESSADLLPRVHRVVSLLKRWLLGTHQGAVSFAHLDYYLDEFTFRFNRRRSRHRGTISEIRTSPSRSPTARVARFVQWKSRPLGTWRLPGNKRKDRDEGR